MGTPSAYLDSPDVRIEELAASVSTTSVVKDKTVRDQRRQHLGHLSSLFVTSDG